MYVKLKISDRMKKIEIIKLNQLIKADLDARRMNALKGGTDDEICRCSCNGCSCPNWDGTGEMPQGTANTQLFTYTNQYADASLTSYLY